MNGELNLDALTEALRRNWITRDPSRPSGYRGGPFEMDAREYAEAIAESYAELAICECGNEVASHSGGWVLLHHDTWMREHGDDPR